MWAWEWGVGHGRDDVARCASARLVPQPPSHKRSGGRTAASCALPAHLGGVSLGLLLTPPSAVDAAPPAPPKTKLDPEDDASPCCCGCCCAPKGPRVEAEAPDADAEAAPKPPKPKPPPPLTDMGEGPWLRPEALPAPPDGPVPGAAENTKGGGVVAAVACCGCRGGCAAGVALNAVKVKVGAAGAAVNWKGAAPLLRPATALAAAAAVAAQGDAGAPPKGGAATGANGAAAAAGCWFAGWLPKTTRAYAAEGCCCACACAWALWNIADRSSTAGAGAGAGAAGADAPLGRLLPLPPLLLELGTGAGAGGATACTPKIMDATAEVVGPMGCPRYAAPAPADDANSAAADGAVAAGCCCCCAGGGAAAGSCAAGAGAAAAANWNCRLEATLLLLLPFCGCGWRTPPAPCGHARQGGGHEYVRTDVAAVLVFGFMPTTLQRLAGQAMPANNTAYARVQLGVPQATP